MSEPIPAAQPCPICGQTQYEWGEIHATRFIGDAVGNVFNRPVDAGRLGDRLRARKCRHCGNVQYFVANSVMAQHEQAEQATGPEKRKRKRGE